MTMPPPYPYAPPQQPQPLIVQVPTPAPEPAKGLTMEEVMERVEAARKEEKDKLYPELEATKAQVATLSQDLEARKAAEEEAQRQAAEAERLRIEAEMSTEERISARLAETNQELSSMRQSWEMSEALRQKESQMFNLESYRNRRISEETSAGTVSPDLADFIRGNTEAEIESSIELVRTKTAAILADFANSQRPPPPRVGIPITGGPTLDADHLSGQAQTRQVTAEDIRNMTMEEYEASRGVLHNALREGISQSGVYGV